MSKTLEAVRTKYPQYRDVPDDDLAVALAVKAPVYLKQDPDFQAEYSAAAARRQAPIREDANRLPPPESLATYGGPPKSLPSYREGMEALGDELPVLGLPGQAVARGGKVALAAAADLASLYPGGPEPGVQNLRTYAEDPTRPLPVEEGLAEMRGLSSIPTKAAAGLIRAVPAIGASVGLGAMGVPAPLAAAIPLSADETGTPDPVSAVVAMGLPAATRIGEGAVTAVLAKMPAKEVVVDVISRAPYQLRGRVVQQFGPLNLTDDMVRQWLETGGGAVAANAYLLASQTPEILAMPEEDRGEAILNSLAANLGPSLIGFASRRPMSQTLQDLYPSLAARMQRAMERPQKPRVGAPTAAAEEGGSTPPPSPSVPPPTPAPTPAPPTAPTPKPTPVPQPAAPRPRVQDYTDPEPTDVVVTAADFDPPARRAPTPDTLSGLFETGESGALGFDVVGFGQRPATITGSNEGQASEMPAEVGATPPTTPASDDQKWGAIDKIVKAAWDSGFEVVREDVSGFGSVYITIRDPGNRRDYKLRIADHARQLSAITNHAAPQYEQIYGKGDMPDVEAAISWIKTLRERIDNPPPFDQQKAEARAIQKAADTVRRFEASIKAHEAKRDLWKSRGREDKAANFQRMADQERSGLEYQTALRLVNANAGVSPGVAGTKTSLGEADKGSVGALRPEVASALTPETERQQESEVKSAEVGATPPTTSPEPPTVGSTWFRGHAVGQPFGNTETFLARTREQAAPFASQTQGVVSAFTFEQEPKVYPTPIPWQEYQSYFRNSVLLKGFDAVWVIEPNGQDLSLAVRNPKVLRLDGGQSEQVSSPEPPAAPQPPADAPTPGIIPVGDWVEYTTSYGKKAVGKVDQVWKVGSFVPGSPQQPRIEYSIVDEAGNPMLSPVPGTVRRIERPNTEPPVAQPQAPAVLAGASPGDSLADMVSGLLQAGNTVRGDFVRAQGKLTGLSDKDAEEWAELGATEAARVIAQTDGVTDLEKFHALVNLYERMPTASTRTVETKVNQQYSTPPPLAWLGSVLADFRGGTTTSDFTAGHGMLSIGLGPNSKLVLNELDEKRRQRLERFAKGFKTQTVVTDSDATDAKFLDRAAATKIDRLGLNPPFGSVLGPSGEAKRFPIRGSVTTAKDTTSIDLAIALNALDVMEKNGKAFIIIGSKTGTPFAKFSDDPADRAKDYRRPVMMEFFQRFNVVDWFTLGGDLYRKMGAGWPVDVIVVHGKGQTKGSDAGGIARPWVNPPRVYEHWADLAGMIPQTTHEHIKTEQPAPQPGGTGAGRPGGRPGGSGAGGGGGGPRGPRAPKVPAPRPERPAAPDGGSGGGTAEQPTERPAAPDQPPAGVPGDSSAGIGTGAAEAPGGVAQGPTLPESPQPTGVGSPGPVVPGTGAQGGKGVSATPPALPSTEGLPASLMVPYVGVSKGPSLNLVAPRNIAQQMLNAQRALEQEVGMPADQYVAGKLGREVATLHQQMAGAQIDAVALAIRNIERGTGLIVADETGVGKGRMVAAVIEYARQRGIVPIFVTAKKNLYSDMVGRDLVALGNQDFKPFVTDNQHYYEDGRGREVKVNRKAAVGSDLMASVVQTGNLPEGAQAVFTTYSQLGSDKPTGWKEDAKAKFRRKNARQSKPDGPRWAMLRALSPRSIFILDEAHLAAGKDSEVNMKFAELLPKARGVYYSSATFAKRPDNLGLYALGTSMKKAGIDPEHMAEALTKGGVPMQQALTSMLAESGELVRRQQDWTGVQFRFQQTSTDTQREIEAADTYTAYIRDLMTLASLVNRAGAALEDGDNQVRAEEERVAIEPVTFGSRLFNLSNQYLLALRAEAIVTEAVKQLKAGRKPFIALYNTMEGPILDLKARKLPLSFGGILRREMAKMLKLTVRDPMADGGKREVELRPEDLPDGGDFYRALEGQVTATDFTRFPISPIDFIKRGLTEAGFKVGELTARDGEVDDTGEEVVLTRRERLERNKVLKAYNDGDLDVIVVNGSGSTGLSAHTDPRFKDKRQRVMIVGQPAPDINEFMQMLGRVMRSGQLSKPEYSILMTALAAERRFATMLRGKMTSLNANTTAEGESALTQDEAFAADIFNEIGDKVVFQVLDAHPEEMQMMDIGALPPDGPDENFARWATGRFVLLPNEKAQRLYDQIITQYKDEIRRLDEAGENPLRAVAEDLRARTVESEDLVQGTGDTPFDGPAKLERTVVVPPKTPPTHAEAVAEARENFPPLRAKAAAWIEASKKAEEDRIAAAAAKGATDVQIARIRENHDRARQAVSDAYRLLGDTYGVDSLGDGSTAYHGVAVNLKLVGADVADYASPSRQELILRTNTYRRTLSLPLSKLFRPDGSTMLNAIDESEAAETFDRNAESSTERFIVTGNLLRGWESATKVTSKNQGGNARVAIFTREDRTLATGILMPPGWGPGGSNVLRDVQGTGEFLQFLQDGVTMFTTDADHVVKIRPRGEGQFGAEVAVPSNMKGRVAWGDPQFRDFFIESPIQRGGMMVGTLSPGQGNLVRFYGWLSNKGWGLLADVGGNPGGAESADLSARGVFVSGESRGPGRGPANLPVQFGGMNLVRPLEMPELVRLVRELTGAVPGVGKLRGKALGRFVEGEIKLDPTIFKDSLVAAKVLAHEIGHLVDYLPHQTLKRGNLLGHLLALRSFLRHTFGGLVNKELRDELTAVTRWWRPYDPATDPKSYVKYRQSPEELYADAVSVLFNAPSELEARAPKFYQAFWTHLDARPDARDALFELQTLLNRGRRATAEERERNIEEAFARGEDRWKAATEARQKAARSWSGWWTRLGQELYWKFYPLEQRANQVERRGVKLKMEADPRVFLDDLGFRDVTVMRWGRLIHERVIQPIEDAGLTLEDAGKLLLYERVLKGDRAGLANPGGMTPDAARLGLLKMNLELGLPKLTLLRDAIARFHAEVFKLAKQAVAVGAYNRETFRRVIEPNKDSYATFAVLDYLADYIPPGIKEQIGTLKDVANPFQATILKSIGLLNLIAHQQAKRGTVKFMRDFFPGDFERVQGPHEPPHKPGKGRFMVLEDGRPAWYYTDPYIADAFEHANPRQLWWLARVADTVFRRFVYPLIITYNPGFLYVMSPLRDIQRTARNTPGGFRAVGPTARAVAGLGGIVGAAGLAGAAAGGVVGGPLGAAVGGFIGSAVGGAAGAEVARGGRGIVGETARRYTGEAGPLIREMEANLALGTPFDQLARANRDDFMGDLLRRMRVLPTHEQQGWWQANVLRLVGPLLERLEAGGMTLDALAKVSAYRRLRRSGWSPRKAAVHVRNYAGLPNINKKGLAVRVVRALVPFWNVAMQGWRADAKAATSPNTRTGWWFKYMATNGALRVVLAAAAAGAFGAAIKELFDAISEYNKTNYATIPLGKVSGGDFGQKVTAIRIPEDEAARVLGALISKGIRMLGPDAPELSSIADFGMGQIPSLNPAVTVPKKWMDYAGGENPVDPFTGENIVGYTAQQARPADSTAALSDMAAWTLRQTGVLNFFKYDPRAERTWELSLASAPAVNRFVTVTDQGYREQQVGGMTAEEASRAAARLSWPEDVQSLLVEHNYLQRLNRNRTPEQHARYQTLHQWHTSLYSPAWEALEVAINTKDRPRADAIRANLRDASKGVRK